MDYVAGTTLRALIDEGPLPPQRALALTRQIAAGLAHAHAQGIVHRDVKPANIMISRGDRHRRSRADPRFRARAAARQRRPRCDADQRRRRHAELHGAGADDRRRHDRRAHRYLRGRRGAVRDDRRRSAVPAEDTMALLGMHRAAPIPRLADRVQGRRRAPGRPPGADRQGDGEVARRSLPDRDRARRGDRRGLAARGCLASIGRCGRGAPRRPTPTASRRRWSTSTRPDVDRATPHRRARSAARAARTAGSARSCSCCCSPAPRRGATGPSSCAGAWRRQRRRSRVASGRRPAVGRAGGRRRDRRAARRESRASRSTPGCRAAAPMRSREARGSASTPRARLAPVAGSAAGEEIEMDPETATTPTPAADTPIAEDEAADAPETAEDVEKRQPPEPPRSPRRCHARGPADQGRQAGRSRWRASTPLWKKSRRARTSRSCSATSITTSCGGRSRWTTTRPRSRRTAPTGATRR